MSSQIMVVCLLACATLTAQTLAAQSLPSTGVPAPRPALGGVSNNGIVKFEDVKPLTPEMAEAVRLLRAENFQQALTQFRQIRDSHPQEALAYEGEIESSDRLGKLDGTVARYRNLLSDAKAAQPHSAELLAVLHWALGQAVMIRNGYYPRFIGDNPSNLGAEPREQFLEALRRDPHLLVARLSLASYYEHHSQEKGTLARADYEKALRLRPDLFKIRYLHALTWTRPGYPGPEQEARMLAMGHPISEDHKLMPEKAVAECLALIRDYPTYPPPYYTAGDYYLWPLGDKANAKKYLSKYIEIGNPETDAWKRAKEVIAYL